MSTRRTYMIEVKKVKIIKSFTLEEIIEMEDSLLNMIREKFNRLKSLLSSCKVSFKDSCLIIQDDLGIVTDLKSILESFGINARDLINENHKDIKGKVYFAKDELIDFFLLIMGEQKKIKGLIDEFFVKSDINDELYSYYINQLSIDNFKNINDLEKNTFFNKMIQSIRHGKSLEIQYIDTQQITEYEGITIDNRVIKTNSDEDKYKEVEDKLKKIAHKISSNHKVNLVEGTTKSLELKAKKMGYSVIKKKNGEEVQLVLVRGR